MNNFVIDFKVPVVLVKQNNTSMLKTSMVLSTLLSCALITFIPQLMPFWIQLAATPGK